MYPRLRERFRTDLDAKLLENPLAPRGSENARWLLAQRYCLDRYDAATGGLRPETGIEEVARRVSRIITSSESLNVTAKDINWLRTLELNLFNDILSAQFLFNSPCLFGAGSGLVNDPEYVDLVYKSPDEMSYKDYRKLIDNKTSSQQLFACFVISVPDSIEGIFEAVRDAAVISKFGGGVGGNFGHLREFGGLIKGGTGGKASGPVSFMETWNTMGGVVVQGGRRRAALMGMLPDNHPDIYRFIDAKTEDGKLSYFNISVCVSDALIKSAQEGGDFALISRVDNSVASTVKGSELWTKLCENAWKRGDPGVFFIDRARADNLLRCSADYEIESTNPCGEQPLPNYTSCNLGSINLSAFVVPGAGGHDTFDEKRFIDQVYRSMYYLDLVIDACSYPLDRIARRTKAIRPVGLGVMGLADTAIKTGLVYGSPDFGAFCDRLSKVMSTAALRATIDNVTENGKAPFDEHGLVKQLFNPVFERMGGELFAAEHFGNMTRSEYDGWVTTCSELGMPYTLCNTLRALPDTLTALGGDEKMLADTLKAVMEGQLRNSRRLSIAPTGSISMLLDSSAGIEPNFAWNWTRKVMRSDGAGFEMRDYYHPLVHEQGKEDLKTTGKISDPRYVTAYDLSPDTHVEVTGIFARYVDSGISKTVNLPSEATVEDVRKVYERCFDLGCKGITIYRDGSRTDQPIETKKVDEDKSGEEKPTAAAAQPHSAKVRQRSSQVLMGKTIRDTTPWGSLFVTLNYDGAHPFEVFASLGKSGSELKGMTEALSRVISIGLRSGGRLEDFIGTLRGLSGKEYWTFDCDDSLVVRSIPDALAILMSKLIEGDEKESHDEGGTLCPECGSPMELVGGCAYCFSCGYSPCK